MAYDSKRKSPSVLKYIFGGLSGMMATCFVQPLDLVKTRMQLSSSAQGVKEFRNTWHCLTSVVQNEGFLALYNGIGAALLRQATYTTVRLGVYTRLNENYHIHYESKPSIGASALMGMIAGGIGAYAGTPAEVALIRMTSDGRLPLDERRNYSNVINALVRITREEGLQTLWRGSLPTVGRAMVVNATQLASYSQFKHHFHDGPLKMPDGIGLHFISSMLSGFLTTITSLPLDIAKTKIQNQKVENGKPEYKGTIDVLFKVIGNEGLFNLWKGFTPYFCRIGPHTVLTFVFLEQLNRLYAIYVLGITSTGSGL